MQYISQLQFVLITLFVVGFGLPLVNVVLGALTSSGDADLDVDAQPQEMDLDIGLDLEAETGAAGMAEAELPDADALPAARHGRRDGIRFNMNCLCLSLVVFSAVSYYRLQFVQDTPSLAGVLAVDAAAALLAYLLLYRLVVKRLKDNDAYALKADRLLHKRAIVKLPIVGDRLGKIELRDAVGAPIAYLARIDRELLDDAEIPAGEEVVITEIDKRGKICYVSIPDIKILK